MKKCLITAEIGCNHNGSAELAGRMIDEARACGADAVKFQTFHSELFISRYAPKAPYQKETTGAGESQLEMTRKLELPEAEYLRLREYALSLGLKVFSTPFDSRAVDFLAGHGQCLWKIPSGEITNLPLLEIIRDVRVEGKVILLSTGMASLAEIGEALKVLEEDNPDQRIILLHCHTAYPTEDGDMNLLAIRDLREKFPGYEIGLSDHSRGCTAPLAAVSLGIVYLEKHFTLDRSLPGPDHQASITPEELKRICREVRRAEAMLGSGEKHMTAAEAVNRVIARKSIVAAKAIRKGEPLSVKNLACKRPGNGISPMRWYEVLGREADRDYESDEPIALTGFPWQEES